MIILFWIFLFIVSLYGLVWSARVFTVSAERLGHALRMPNFLIGTVIVAIGTSAPEALTSIFGTRAGESTFLAGDVMGSVIANTLLGLGIAVVLSPRLVKFHRDVVSYGMPMFFISAVLLLMVYRDRVLTITEAFLLLLGYCLYLLFVVRVYKQPARPVGGSARVHPVVFTFPQAIFFLLSLGILLLTSHVVVQAVFALASLSGIGSVTLAASAVAIGTSLPEILVATVAARKGNTDLALGDIVGSNIFDIFVIFGVGGLLARLRIDDVMWSFGMPILLASVLLLWIVLARRQLTRLSAVLFLVLYSFFLMKLFDVV